MNFCTNCGAERVVGRFCTNCGAPSTAAATPAGDTAERPAVGRAAPPAEERAAERTSERPAVRAGITPVEPPPAYTGQLGDGSRYPLYADEVDSATAPPTRHRRPRTATTAPAAFPLWLPVVAVLVVLAMVVGVWMLTRDGDGGDTAADQPTSDAPSASQPSESDPPADEEPTSPAGAGRQPDRPRGRLHRHRAEAAGARPGPRAATRWRYPPANMLDDDLATAYRIPGDASGETVVFTLAGGGGDQRGGPGQRLRQEGQRRVADRRLVPPEPQDPQGRVGLRRRHHGGAGPARRAGAADHRRRQGAHQHDLAADPRGVRSRAPAR